eukprot:3138686-Alexandrium_andersonii.AAC.1
MSASLVGSEMCIRDRVKWGWAPPQSPALAEVEEEQVRQLAVRQEEGAVSYTHLTLPTICSV